MATCAHSDCIINSDGVTDCDRIADTDIVIDCDCVADIDSIIDCDRVADTDIVIDCDCIADIDSIIDQDRIADTDIVIDCDCVADIDSIIDCDRVADTDIVIDCDCIADIDSIIDQDRIADTDIVIDCDCVADINGIGNIYGVNHSYRINNYESNISFHRGQSIKNNHGFARVTGKFVPRLACICRISGSTPNPANIYIADSFDRVSGNNIHKPCYQLPNICAPGVICSHCAVLPAHTARERIARFPCVVNLFGCYLSTS